MSCSRRGECVRGPTQEIPNELAPPPIPGLIGSARPHLHCLHRVHGRYRHDHGGTDRCCSAFAFAGLVGGEGGIRVQSVAGGLPTKIADGTWVMSSPV
ncbi:MAG: hypothetical protein GY720_06750 [bacterium]|nr:hypothetical protein [bacterium]